MKKILKTMSVAFLSLGAAQAFAQSTGVAINTTGATANNSAMLDVSSTSKGVLTPRMTAAQKTAISAPATGLLIYQTDGTKGFYYYTGSAWQMVGAGATSAFNDTLAQNLFTNGYLLTDDGATGVNIMSNGNVAIGSGSTASGTASFAAGHNSSATGSAAVALGAGSHASGDGSVALDGGSANNNGTVAIGALANANGTSSIAVGQQATAVGPLAVSIGTNSTASGGNSFAIGTGVTASGLYANALGYNTTASGDHSTAMGNNASTNGQNGSFTIADNAGTTLNNDAPNQMAMRFTGGYKLYTDNASTQGALLNTNGVMEYMNNVAANYDTRSLVDKNYVDSSMVMNKFNDTLTRNLFTNGYLLTDDGVTGISLVSGGGMAAGSGCSATGTSATALGFGAAASGYRSIAEGNNSTASGDYSVAMGNADTAGNSNSVAMGVASNATGNTSTAIGYHNQAKGYHSAAIGDNVVASGDETIAMGQYTTASDENATAMGQYTTASGPNSTAMGQYTTASGANSTAMGQYTTAGGYRATAIGERTTASALDAIAMGQNSTASGDYSTAMGNNASTNGMNGSFAIADNAGTSMNNDATNQMAMRFIGGYKLYTDNAGTQGALLNTNGVMEYMNNVAANYDTRSLVDKNYVDSSMVMNKFNDTLTRNLFTNGYLLTDDGVTGINILGNGAVTMGTNSVVPGANSMTAGFYNSATGNTSIAMGVFSIASGGESVAIGSNALALADHSFALGNFISTNGHKGAFAIGDDNSLGTVSLSNDANNQMAMRFTGGYKLYTDLGVSQGVDLNANGVMDYMNDVSSSFDNLSLVNKGYVDSHAFNDTLTQNLFTNGYLLTNDGVTGVNVLSNGAVAIGENTFANGVGSFAAGSNSFAPADNGIAMGSYVSTAAQNGSIIFGDNSTTNPTDNDAANQMMMRFAGGYKLFTSSDGTQGALLNPNGVMEYMNNVAAGYDSRSLVDKNYVDSSISANIVSFNDTLAQNLVTNGHLITDDGATGINVMANGAVAIGSSTTATGISAFAAGVHNTASGDTSTAMGAYVSTNGNSGSFIIGDNSTTTQTKNDAANQMKMRFTGGYKLFTNISTQAGLVLTTNEGGATLGSSNSSSGTNAIAIGSELTASGDTSTAMGAYVSTAGKAGSFIIGDNSTTSTTNNDAANQMKMRFAGGYKLYTNSAATQGAALKTNGVMEYMNNVAAAYDTRSLVDKNYVDSSISANTASFNDTLTSNLFTNGHLITDDGTTGIKVMANGAVAVGSSTSASVPSAFATGVHTTASGDTSTAMGAYVSTNGENGSFIIGDNSTVSATKNDAANQMKMRFTGGYVLFSNSALTAGLWLMPGGGANMGLSNTVSGTNAIAIGSHVTANGDSSTAMGANVSTDGESGSFIIGDNSTTITTDNDAANQMKMRFAGGYKLFTNNSTQAGLTLTGNGGGAALGASNTSSGTSAIAIGSNLTASGDTSTAMGAYVSTNGENGSFIIGDNSTTGTATNDAANQMKMRFTGGYKLFSNSALTAGLQLIPGGGANIGISNTVTGTNAIAIGSHVTASGDTSMALGAYVSTNGMSGSMAIGDNSTTTGMSNNAANQMRARFAGGYELYSNSALTTGFTVKSSGAITSGTTSNTATGDCSVAMGENVQSEGHSSVAMGEGSSATGDYSTALGYLTEASGNISTALGYNVGTGNKTGSFIIGDGGYITVQNNADDQMMMRFDGGYMLYSNTASTIGVQLPANGNSWFTVSDRRKKENFAPVNGEELLYKIDSFNLTSWNYKGQDAKTFRHYGPMAQDFYAAFGKDSYGIIGNDTTIGQADMEGVTFTMVQALEKRTKEQQREIDQLKAENAKLVRTLQDSGANVEKMVQSQADLLNRIDKLEASLNNHDLDKVATQK